MELTETSCLTQSLLFIPDIQVLDDIMVHDEEAEVVGYKVHVSGVIAEVYEENFLYLIQKNFFIIVIFMYPMPSLTHMLDILGNFYRGVSVPLFINKLLSTSY